MARELRDIEPLRTLLTRRPIALFSDIDGTLSPIVDKPKKAKIAPRCRELLKALMEEDVLVALITGRPIETARRMTGLEGAVYAADHGLSLWIDGHEQMSDAVREYIELAQRVKRETAAIVSEGVFVEVTGPNVAFHYRLASNEEAARRSIQAALEASRSAQRFRSNEGRKHIGLRPRLDIDKGTALTGLARRFEVAALLCLGDDQTDIDMFNAVTTLRDGGLLATKIAVHSEEVAPELLASADYFVRDVPGVERFLDQLLRALRQEAP